MSTREIRSPQTNLVPPLRWWACAAAVVLAWLVAAPAQAHMDPEGCSDPAVGMVLAGFRAGGTAFPLSTTSTVSECETVCFLVTLRKPADPTFCAFEGG